MLSEKDPREPGLGRPAGELVREFTLLAGELGNDPGDLGPSAFGRGANALALVTAGAFIVDFAFGLAAGFAEAFGADAMASGLSAASQN